MIRLKDLNAYRSKTFRLNWLGRVRTLNGAIDYINERGFIFFWPITGIPLPSLWVAAAGERPVADAHDDPGHVTWGWKDSLLGQRRIYYSRMLRKKNMMISLETAPYFYALTPNFGSPEEDYLTQYEMGQITMETKLVYEALLRDGPLHTIDLRKKTHLTGPGTDSKFNRALETLQVDMRILPVGVARAGAWHYAFIYDTVHHHIPDVIERSIDIGEKEARLRLLQLYFNSIGAALYADAAKLFGWPAPILDRSLDELAKLGGIVKDQAMENVSGEWIALPELT